MVGQDEQDELDFEAARHTHPKLNQQRKVERGTTLGVQGGNLAVHIADGLALGFHETLQARLQTGDVGQEMQGFHGQTMLVAFQEKIDAQAAEHGAHCEEHRHAGRHASTIKHQVQKNGEIQKL